MRVAFPASTWVKPLSGATAPRMATSTRTSGRARGVRRRCSRLWSSATSYDEHTQHAPGTQLCDTSRKAGTITGHASASTRLQHALTSLSHGRRQTKHHGRSSALYQRTGRLRRRWTGLHHLTSHTSSNHTHHLDVSSPASAIE